MASKCRSSSPIRAGSDLAARWSGRWKVLLVRLVKRVLQSSAEPPRRGGTEIVRDDGGLAASPPMGYTLVVARERSLAFVMPGLGPALLSRRIRWLANRPGEPMTQPPGWVPEPHW